MKDSGLTTYQAGVLQARAYRALKSFMASHLRPHELTFVQWSILGLAYDYTGKGGVKVSQLAELLKVEISLVTTTLNQMEPRGLVERLPDEEDSRAKRVVVTRVGERQVKKIEGKLRRDLDKWLEDIHDKQLSLYIRTLQQLARKVLPQQ
jgi:DNA-binding MarR family transcriptional regulator